MDFSRIPDTYTDLCQVSQALRGAGLESSNLIFGIDFTKSNEWTGRYSFGGQSLHSISPYKLNPYEHAITVIGNTLSSLDEDQKIPCFGFGDVTTYDQKVFSFYPNCQPCFGVKGVLDRYRQIIPYIRLSGPTSFAPVIRAAIDVVKASGNRYHILVIIADGQVTGNVGMGRLSQQEKATIDAIVEASNYPLSIIMVGVGDGPWDTMKQFDDAIPKRRFDNFQFVNYTQIMNSNHYPRCKEAQFALAALMEIPKQYVAIKYMQGVRYPMTPNRCYTCVIPPPLPC